MPAELRRTALTARHAAAGAVLAPFAGYELPLRFAGTLLEHHAVREDVGVFDVSHLGVVRIVGPQAAAVVAATFTNDPARLDPGAAQYSLCCDDDGGIVDDLLVYRLAPDELLAVPNAANTAAVVAALVSVGGDAEVIDETGRWAILAVQGPAAFTTVDRVVLGLGPEDADDELGSVAQLPYLGVVGLALDDELALLARTGYTGEPGVELIVPAAVADDLWDRLVDAGVTPCGLGARDTLRLEMGYPLHGAELTPDVDPYEARLGWAVVLDRGPFRGQAALRERHAAGPMRRLWGVLGEDRRPLRAGLQVVPADGVGPPVGVVTSGGFSPTLARGIGLALLLAPHGPGDLLAVDARGSRLPVEVVRPPFVARDPRR